MLVRDGAVIPHAEVAQSTAQIDWRRLELRVYATGEGAATGRVALPDAPAHAVRVVGSRLESDPLAGRVTWRVTRVPVEGGR
ncbi:MAG TPA: hypothetical protein VEA99_12975, partial [Gemmatimonadaceae bacterium]|nr:hypothetical protein [Gemmatimonadaceae bacterium]